jgi:hypothetical protein
MKTRWRLHLPVRLSVLLLLLLPRACSAAHINPLAAVASQAASSVGGVGGPLSTLVDALVHPRHKYWFVPPNTQVEELPDGAMTMDGGVYDSKYRGDCAKLAEEANGVCPAPCAMTWSNGACIVKGARTGACICVDPCSAFDLPAYDEWGHESLLSGCDSCVRHKAKSHLRFEGWAMGGTPYTCGYCGNACVSGNKNGPSKSVLEDCGDQWDWTLQHCRRREPTSEEIAGSETEESFDPYGETPPEEGAPTFNARI